VVGDVINIKDVPDAFAQVERHEPIKIVIAFG
jgi:hypothetical protein